MTQSVISESSPFQFSRPATQKNKERIQNLFKRLMPAIAAFAFISLNSLSPAPAHATASYAVFGAEVVHSAKQHLGLPYVWGGESPVRGFDCSGLITYIFREFNVTLPHRADLQFNYGTPVDRSQLEAGDIVFFSSGGYRIGHVGIYAGNNEFIHAPRTGKPVQIDSMSSGWYQARYVGARRILPEYF